MTEKQAAKRSGIKADALAPELYSGAPIVPWTRLGHGNMASDSYIAPELCVASNLPSSGVDDLLRASNRVLLRELLVQGKVSVLAAESSNPYFDISVVLEGEDRTELGYWDIDECGYRPIWDWWSEYTREVVCDYSEEDESDDLVEYSVTVSPWSDPMDYAATASACAEAIVAASQERRIPGKFGAADAVLALVAAHPRTPIDVLRKLSLESDVAIRRAVLGNEASPEEVRVMAGLSEAGS